MSQKQGSHVKIPKSLIKRLKPFGARFIKVESPTLNNPRSGKKAIEDAWQDRPYEADDFEITNWLEGGGNYGILCGKGLYEVDLDEPEMWKLFEEKIETFTVKSGSGDGRHYFIKSNLSRNGTVLTLVDEKNPKKKRKNLGNVQVNNKYVVGANCNHWTGNKYEILKDVPIAWVDVSELEEIFGKRLVWSKMKLTEDQARYEADQMAEKGFDIPILEIINIEGLKQISMNEWQGEHPIHGSTSGVNFCVNTNKNCWHCFRCNSGGGALTWLAVKNHLIRCDEAQTGALKGALFKKVLDFAKKEGYEIPTLETEEINIEPDVKQYFEGRRFVSAFLATELIKEFHYVTREADEFIFRYHVNKGVYTPNGEAHIKKQVNNRLRKHFSRHRQNEVLAYIEAATIQKVEDCPPHLIVLKNGIVNLETGKLQPFDPEYFILNALPVKYDPEAKCPKIMKFMTEILHKEDIPITQEVVGYCLYRKYPLQKAVMLVGGGANGKSTLLELLRTMLNNENVSTEPLQTLETNRFALVSLFGKLANIYPDLSDTSLKATGKFKMLTGKDTITGEYKYKDRFCFRSYAKLIFSANKIPESPDDSDAFFRRWIIINFPNQFLADDPDTDINLIDKLTTEAELSGFFNWALEGLQRLLKNKKFSNAISIEETREKYIRSSNPVQAFVTDCVEFDSNSFVSKTKLYAAFLSYCQKMKLSSGSKTAFERKLIENVPSIQTVRRAIAGVRTRCWLGLTMGATKYAQKAHETHPFVTVSHKLENISTNKKSGKSTKKAEKVGVLGVPPEKKIEEWEDVTER